MISVNNVYLVNKGAESKLKLDSRAIMHKGRLTVLEICDNDRKGVDEYILCNSTIEMRFSCLYIYWYLV